MFSAGFHTDTIWPGVSLSLPEHLAEPLVSALQHALYGAHKLRHIASCATILILPEWKHTPYMARNLHINYVQKLTTIPYSIAEEILHTKQYDLGIYIVANRN